MTKIQCKTEVSDLFHSKILKTLIKTKTASKVDTIKKATYIKNGSFLVGAGENMWQFETCKNADLRSFPSF